MNPAGILFGANASLNVPASFTATTANAIKVGDQWFGMNTSVDALNTMTGTPNGYAFLNGNTGAIVNQGNLSLSAGQTLTLVGGLVLNTGTITTPEGKINIAASEGGRFVKITPEGSLLSFELPIAEQTNIAPTTILNAVNLPALLTGQPAGTAIAKGQLSVGQGGSTSFIHVLGERVDATDAQIAAGSGTGASN
jgi:large exoprotein involved in heme utilization and adhesion